MAKDIKILFDSELLSGDIGYANGDLLREEGLSSAVLISLFTDARVNDENILDDINDKRGWWGDKVDTAYPNDNTGSKLWLLERQKITTQVANLVKIYIEQALQWMIDDGVVGEIEVSTEIIYRNSTKDTIAASIKLYKNGVGQPILTMLFNDVWEAQFRI